MQRVRESRGAIVAPGGNGSADMLLPGRLAASAAALGRISTAVEDFFDRLVWPDMPRQHR
jgi:hypothetical protein